MALNIICTPIVATISPKILISGFIKLKRESTLPMAPALIIKNRFTPRATIIDNVVITGPYCAGKVTAAVIVAGPAIMGKAIGTVVMSFIDIESSSLKKILSAILLSH